MGPPFGGSLTGLMSNVTTCGNHSGTKPNTIPGQAEKCSASARNPVRLQPGILFGISPEPCSASPRNPVRLPPESAVTAAFPEGRDKIMLNFPCYQVNARFDGG